MRDTAWAFLALSLRGQGSHPLNTAALMGTLPLKGTPHLQSFPSLSQLLWSLGLKRHPCSRHTGIFPSLPSSPGRKRVSSETLTGGCQAQGTTATTPLPWVSQRMQEDSTS